MFDWGGDFAALGEAPDTSSILAGPMARHAFNPLALPDDFWGWPNAVRARHVEEAVGLAAAFAAACCQAPAWRSARARGALDWAGRAAARAVFAACEAEPGRQPTLADLHAQLVQGAAAWAPDSVEFAAPKPEAAAALAEALTPVVTAQGGLRGVYAGLFDGAAPLALDAPVSRIEFGDVKQDEWLFAPLVAAHLCALHRACASRDGRARLVVFASPAFAVGRRSYTTPVGAERAPEPVEPLAWLRTVWAITERPGARFVLGAERLDAFTACEVGYATLTAAETTVVLAPRSPQDLEAACARLKWDPDVVREALDLSAGEAVVVSTPPGGLGSARLPISRVRVPEA